MHDSRHGYTDQAWCEHLEQELALSVGVLRPFDLRRCGCDGDSAEESKCHVPDRWETLRSGARRLTLAQDDARVDPTLFHVPVGSD